MENSINNIEIISKVVLSLDKSFIDKIIFVGGSVVGLYSTNLIKEDVRFT